MVVRATRSLGAAGPPVGADAEQRPTVTDTHHQRGFGDLNAAAGMMVGCGLGFVCWVLLILLLIWI